MPHPQKNTPLVLDTIYVTIPNGGTLNWATEPQYYLGYLPWVVGVEFAKRLGEAMGVKEVRVSTSAGTNNRGSYRDAGEEDRYAEEMQLAEFIKWIVMSHNARVRKHSRSDDLCIDIYGTKYRTFKRMGIHMREEYVVAKVDNWIAKNIDETDVEEFVQLENFEYILE